MLKLCNIRKVYQMGDNEPPSLYQLTLRWGTRGGEMENDPVRLK